MSSGRQTTVRDLLEEAKKRIVLLVICVVGLSYLMSLTSSSVWVNMPAAASLIILLRYLSLDFDMRRRAAAHKQSPASNLPQKKPMESSKSVIEKSSWRRKVKSPVVETAIDQFTRHLISEWVTDLWYSRLTPDRDGPEELVQIMNDVLGEISCRLRDINLINLLTRDIMNLICAHLEDFQVNQAKIEKQQIGNFTIYQRDVELRLVLVARNKLHPALFSAEAEHKVLQHLMDGLISLTFKPEDLQCSFFRYIVRELLACAVMRPVLNLASPRFINERIEMLVNKKVDKGVASSTEETSQSKPSGPSKPSSDQFSVLHDNSVTGVELVQFNHDKSKAAAKESKKGNLNGTLLSKDPLLSVDARSSRSWSSLPSDSQTADGHGIRRHQSGGEWGEMLDVISLRKTKALAPEHFENMWTKGRNYRRKEDAGQLTKKIAESSPTGISGTPDCSVLPKHKDAIATADISERVNISTQDNGHISTEYSTFHAEKNSSTNPSAISCRKDNGDDLMPFEEDESESSSSYPTEDEESNGVTGLDSPGTKVWDSTSNRNTSISYIHHPLENSEGRMVRKTGKENIHYQRPPRTQSGRKRSWLSNPKVQTWQEIERTTFLSGDGQDILNSSKGGAKADEFSGNSELETLGRIHSGAAASSSVPFVSVSKSCSSSVKSPESSLFADSFLKLKCEVLGANIVKSGSRTFAVYSISVTDANNNTWSIKRRFRHFEELHRRLKEFPQYNLHLPPKHFLSTGLEISVVQERCKLLDRYLKKLLQLPAISGSIEVWDFLSVDSQTYMFSNSLSIVETLSVDLDDKPYEKSIKVQNFDESGRVKDKEATLQTKPNFVVDTSRVNLRNTAHSSLRSTGKQENLLEDSGSDSDRGIQKNASPIRNSGKVSKDQRNDKPNDASDMFLDAATDPTLPSEWVPPNLSIPILDLVDVIFQLHDRGWIRRQAFWVAKQVLQLGMGDAFDDWLIEKIQLLRKGSVIASAIKRVEQILWPDGIFITKHPKRQQKQPSIKQSQSSYSGQPTSSMSSPEKENIQKFDGNESSLSAEEQQQQEADRRAKFVYELMIDNAPAALVGLVGRKEYERCAKDLYFFLQSSICMKQLAYDLLELLLLSAFPELDDVLKQLHEEKQKFGLPDVN